MGYDLLSRNVYCLKEGAVDFLIAQQPSVQGYSGVESLCNHLIFKKEVKQCNYMPITLLRDRKYRFLFGMPIKNKSDN